MCLADSVLFAGKMALIYCAVSVRGKNKPPLWAQTVSLGKRECWEEGMLGKRECWERWNVGKEGMQLCYVLWVQMFMC